MIERIKGKGKALGGADMLLAVVKSSALASDLLDGHIGEEYKSKLKGLGITVTRRQLTKGLVRDCIVVKDLASLMEITSLNREKEKFGETIIFGKEEETGFYCLTFNDE